jgi:hypothetical protein
MGLARCRAGRSKAQSPFRHGSGTITTTLYWTPPGACSAYSGPTLITSTPAKFSRASLAITAATSRMLGIVSKVGVLVADTFLIVAVGLNNRLNQTFAKYSVSPR